MSKDLLTRTAQFTRILSAPHVGSPLLNPTQLVNSKPPQCTWAVGAVVVGTLSGVYFYTDRTVIAVIAAAEGGTVTFNLSDRATFTGAGTDIMSADMTTDDSETVFDVPTIVAGHWVRLDISACDPGVTAFACTLVVQ